MHNIIVTTLSDEKWQITSLSLTELSECDLIIKKTCLSTDNTIIEFVYRKISWFVPMTCHQSHNIVPRTVMLMTPNCSCHSRPRTVNRLWPWWTMILLSYVTGVLIIGYSWIRTRPNWLYMEPAYGIETSGFSSYPSGQGTFTRRLC